MKTKRISENIVEVDGERYIKEDSSGWLDVPELGISVEIKVHDKGKSWNELNLKDREKELLTAEQCIWLANSKYAKQLKMDGSSSEDDFFIQQPFNLNKLKGLVAWFYADCDWANLYCDRNPSNRDADLGVRFCSSLKN